MILKRYDEIDDNVQNIVLQEFNQIPIEELLKKTKLNKQELISLLIKNNIEYDIDLNKGKTIKENKILIISDTHIGSEYENISYLDMVYEFAIKNNITKIIHGGDLLQSTMKHVKQEYIDPEKQFKHFMSVYPYDRNITNYVTLGNHDLSILDKFEKGINIFKPRKDIKILGFKRTYINWNDTTISILHECPKYQLEIPNLQTIVNLHGHRHNIKVSDTGSIHIPTLSDNVMSYGNNDNPYPGFLVAYIDKNNLYIEHYIIKSKIKNKGIVFTKHI